MNGGDGMRRARSETSGRICRQTTILMTMILGEQISHLFINKAVKVRKSVYLLKFSIKPCEVGQHAYAPFTMVPFNS